MIEIRLATLADVPGLVESSAGLFAEDAGTRDPTLSQDWPRTHGPASLRDGIDDPNRLILTASDGPRIVGHLTASFTPPSAIRPVTVAVLGSMYVFPSHRQSGVGARLVAHFRDWATQSGANLLSVNAYSTNEAAIRFYQREGFGPKSLTLEAIVGPLS